MVITTTNVTIATSITVLPLGCEVSLCIFCFFVFLVFVLFLEPCIHRREAQNCRDFWTRVGTSRLKSVNSHRDRKGPGRERQICRHFWTRVGSSRLKKVNSHRDPGSWSRNAELPSLLDSCLVFVPQNCKLQELEISKGCRHDAKLVGQAAARSGRELFWLGP